MQEYLQTGVLGLYRVAQKSKPLPNFQNIVLNRIKDFQ